MKPARQVLLSWRYQLVVSGLALWMLALSPAKADALQMVLIEGGTVTMGAHPDDPAASPDEFPQRTIAISPFYLAAAPVTRSAFSAFVDASGYTPQPGCWAFTEDGWMNTSDANWRNPGFPQEGDHPVTCVSRVDALAYAAWRSDQDGTTYRLPSEAEWAFSVRGGEELPYWGDTESVCRFGNVNDLTAKNKVAKVAEHCTDGALHTSSVGTYQPNPYGLHDMIGNIWEWLADCGSPDLSALPENGGAHQSADCATYALRGHSWTDAPGPVRLQTRYALPPDARQSIIGFRLARDP